MGNIISQKKVSFAFYKRKLILLRFLVYISEANFKSFRFYSVGITCYGPIHRKTGL
jgi:hypothetical protein